MSEHELKFNPYVSFIPAAGDYCHIQDVGDLMLCGAYHPHGELHAVVDGREGICPICGNQVCPTCVMMEAVWLHLQPGD